MDVIIWILQTKYRLSGFSQDESRNGLDCYRLFVVFTPFIVRQRLVGSYNYLPGVRTNILSTSIPLIFVALEGTRTFMLTCDIAYT